MDNTIKLCEYENEYIDNNGYDGLDDEWAVEVICARHILWLRGDDYPDDYRFDFDGQNFYRKSFDNKDICMARLSNCVVKECSFKDSTMIGFEANNVKFIDCNFDKSCICGSIIKNCQFINCSFGSESYIDSADLDFSNCTFNGCQFNSSMFNELLEQGVYIQNMDSKGNLTYIIPSDDDE